MVDQNLLFANKFGPSTVFVDPTNVDSVLNVRQERSKRKAGKSSVRVNKTEMSLVLAYNKDVCGEGCAVAQQDAGFVRITGADLDTKKRIWESLKANMDRAFAQGYTEGVPVSMNETSFVIKPSDIGSE